MGEYADDAVDQALNGGGWSGSMRRYMRRSRPLVHKPKKTNQEIFANFARDGIKFKAGDRVVHIASGAPGIVLSSRGDKVCWKPDSRINPGGIWIDSDKLRYDI